MKLHTESFLDGFNWRAVLWKLLQLLLTAIAGVIAGQSGPVQNILSTEARYVVEMPADGIGALTALDVPVIGTMEYSPGLIVKTDPAHVQELRNQGYSVYKDRVYTLDMGTCPPTGPTNPTPTEPVDPVNPSLDKVPWGTSRINALRAQARVPKGSKRVRVCVIDTGVDTDHEDLASVVVGGKSFVPGTTHEDDQGHGTHVAGTIAAARNDRGIVGVAAGVAEIYAVKALAASGSGYSSAISDAIYECVRAGSQVINMSLGSPRSGGPDPLIRRATDYAVSKGVHVVAANGNDSRSTGPGYPADNPGVWAISSSTDSDGLSHFSTHGPGTDYIAPGSNVLSTRMGGGYVTMSGTSMATPHVAGVFALCVAVGCRELKAVSLGLSSNQQGMGLPDALKTVEK